MVDQAARHVTTLATPEYHPNVYKVAGLLVILYAYLSYYHPSKAIHK